MRTTSIKALALILLLLLVGVLAASAPSALAAGGWAVTAVSKPSSFGAGDVAACELKQQCDRYQLLVSNQSDEASHGPVTITDTLPAGLHVPAGAAGVVRVNEGGPEEGKDMTCTVEAAATQVVCHPTEESPRFSGEFVEASVPAGHYAATIHIEVTPPAPGASGTLSNLITVQGGGLPSAETTVSTPIERPLAFEVSEFAFEPQNAAGSPALEAGGHPWSVTTHFGIPVGHGPLQAEHNKFTAARNIRSASVELPIGFLGDPLATAHCTETQLREGHCPRDSQVGIYAVDLSSSSEGEFTGTEDLNGGACCSAVYNMVPEAGYPAEFGFTFAKTVPLLVYANVVHTGTGYRVRVTVPGIPEEKEPVESTLTLFGEPGKLNGTGSEAAFLSSPADCTAEAEGISGASRLPLLDGEPVSARADASRIELTAWGEPGVAAHREQAIYSGLGGCDSLAGLFDPTLGLAPSPAGAQAATQEGSSQADEPSAYSVDLKLPQTSGFSEASTPQLRDSSVALPAGVSVSPSAANGLLGCQAQGPEGINIGSNEIGAGGRDEGDPEATELGEGHAGGNQSPYDDGFYHTAPGHCPGASILGSVEVCTPLLPNRANAQGEKVEGTKACEEGSGIAPLQGHVYLAQPKCGGEAQPPCTQASATNGELYGLYIEAQGSGVIVKLPGTVAANPANGQLTTTFNENPQLPFSELKLHLHGGPRASLANPQSCGSFASSSTLTSWAGQSVSQASEPFSISGCTGATPPFAPSFTAGTTNPQAGAYSPFVLSFSRSDREQDLAGLTETMPPGLVGKIAGVEQCPEAQANAGSCPQASEIGTTTATAGPGPEPFVVSGGHVYLTGPYHGAPFGLSIVVPTKAGPFNLGDEVIRAQIHVDPNTAQVTVSTDPLPQSKDGVPFRLRSVSTEVNRPGFISNPTSCAAQAITATISAAQGASSNLSAPFQATGCQSLPFHPTLTAESQGRTSKANGASLNVKVSQRPGEANIHKVNLTLPLALPSRLTTIQKACLAATFQANPASCPEGSDIGTATAHSPLLNSPLSGPAYFVSHGGAAFPDVEFVLQGEGVTIILDGKTDIKKGITYSNFETVPDAPISSFETNFPEGPHSVLTTQNPASTNLCAPTTTKTETVSKKVTKRIHGKKRKVTEKVKKTVAVATKLQIATSITAQSGALYTQSTPLLISGCPKPKPLVKAKPKPKKKKAKKASRSSAAERDPQKS